MRTSSSFLILQSAVARLARPFLPDLPGYEPGGGPVIPQAVILRRAHNGHLGVGQPECGEVLLVKRTSPRAWELPGGYVEPGEPPDEALVREVREETGLDVVLERLVGWYERTGFRPHRSPVYVCRPTGGQVRRSHEAVDIGYFPVDRLPMGLFPWYWPIVHDAAAGVSHAHPRRQRLGPGAVSAALAIHVGELAGLLR